MENSIFCEVLATAAYWESSDITMFKETASAEILPEYETNKSLKRKENTNFQQKPNVIYIYYVLMHSAQYRPLKDCYCYNSVYFIIWRYCTMMRNSKKKCLLVFEKIVLFFTKSLSFYKRIVWKGVSAPPFFFHLPFFRNKQLPPPPPFWHPSQGNTGFYDDTPESERLKAINIKPWKPITYKNCVPYWMCPDRYHRDN